MHRSGGKSTALSALLSCSQRSFLALSDGSILGVTVTKWRVIDYEVSRTLSYVQRRSTILDAHHNNLLGRRNSTIFKSRANSQRDTHSYYEPIC